MSYQSLYLEKSGPVAILILNRPEKLNALNRQLTSELHMALDEVAAGFPDTRVLVLTGEGRGFCSGADLSDQDAAGGVTGQALDALDWNVEHGLGGHDRWASPNPPPT